MSLKNVQQTFETFGREDPFWAVLSDKRFKHNRWDKEAFFATGRREIQAVLDYVAEKGLVMRKGKALDFGCGVGRLSQAMADHFDQVVGVDIAQPMLDVAADHNRHGEHCRYVLNTSEDLGVFEDSGFDFIYSNITLQHMARQHATRYIAEFFRLARPGGVVVFQIPAGAEPIAPGRSAPIRWWATSVRRGSNTWRRLRGHWRRLRRRPVAEMHGTPCTEIERLIEASGGKLVDVVEDDASGKRWQSFRYCATR